MNEQEFISKYGNVKVRFIYYYKYVFQFSGIMDDLDIWVQVGGSGDDVYRLEVTPNKDYEVKELGINYGRAKRNGEVIDEFIEY